MVHLVQFIYLLWRLEAVDVHYGAEFKFMIAVGCCGSTVYDTLGGLRPKILAYPCFFCQWLSAISPHLCQLQTRLMASILWVKVYGQSWATVSRCPALS
jgi:hypothetical protein